MLGLAGKTLPVSRGNRVGSGQTARVSQWRSAEGRNAGGRLGEQPVGEADEISGEVAAQCVPEDCAEML